jgi:hypothetical protein
MSGTQPGFAVQSPTTGSMFVITTPSTPVAEKTFSVNAETGLRKQCSELKGTPQANWVRTSASIRKVRGLKELMIEWNMPPSQNVVLMQKQMCPIVGKTAFLVSATATSDIGSCKEDDVKWFSSSFNSFQVTK